MDNNSLLLKKEISEMSSQQESKYHIKWVLGHSPSYVFDQGCEKFCEIVNEKTDGDVKVEILDKGDYSKLNGGEHIDRKELNDLLASGKIQMAHNYTATLGTLHKNLLTMEMPFIFQDYDHAQRVMESDIAEELMSGLIPKGVRGLAFAYSGGKRIVPTVDKEIHCHEDFKGLTLRSSGSPVGMAIFEELGVKPVPAMLPDVPDLVKNEKIQGSEITWVRYWIQKWQEFLPVVNQVSHTHFTTMTVVNEKFFQSLPEEYQAVLKEAAVEAARIERKVALEEEVKVRNIFKKNGFNFVEMSEDERIRLKEKLTPVFDKFRLEFGKETIDKISDMA